MTDSIKIGIIGCGRIMPAHLRGYKELRDRGIDNFSITALCARRREDALMFRRRGEGPPPRKAVTKNAGDPLGAPHLYVDDVQGKEIDVEVYTDYHEMVEKADIDAVDIYASVFIHHDAAITALKAGKHVAVEKPIAVSVKAAQRMIESAEANGKVLSVAECARYGEGTRAARWIMDEGYIGELQITMSHRIGAGEWSPNKIVAKTPWRHKKLLGGGGGAIDIGVHLYNVTRYICGEIDEVMAVTKTLEDVRYTCDEAGNVIDEVKNEVDDIFIAITKFENGAVGNFSFCWGGHGEGVGLPGQVYYGTKGCMKEGKIFLDDGSSEQVRELFAQKASNELKERFFPLGIKDTFALEKLDFLRAIESGKECETSGREGMRDLAISFAMIESSCLNAPVRIKDVESGKIDNYQKEINEHYSL